MKRPWHVWLLFALCLVVALAVLGWTSATVLDLQRANRQAQTRAELEEDVRLTLWRLDSSLATLIAQENARPYFSYSAFYSAQGPYSRMINADQPLEELVPSPLLTQPPPFIRLHFQFDPDGRLSSPQVPSGASLEMAHGGGVELSQLSIAADRLARLETLVRADRLLAALPLGEQPPPFDFNFVPQIAQNAQPNLPNATKVLSNVSRQSDQEQRRLNRNEFQARAQSLQQLSVESNISNGINTGFSYFSPLTPPEDVRAEPLRPIWMDESLLLARRVVVRGQTYLQGCWLDWPALRESLLSSVQDLLPDASLEPVSPGTGQDHERMLAALPVRLLPAAPIELATGTWTPTEISLFIAWACALVAALAGAVLLWGVVNLSERRGAFVSAVTHELRTPLTTFRMYAEMLAGGMIREEEKRRSYLETLRVEADRLSHLVENVLAYARLERGRPGNRLEAIGVDDLLNRVSGRLVERAQQAGVRMIIDTEAKQPGLVARADSSAVEQILFNLVDNACKYASGSDQAEIHLEADREGRFVVLRVRDNGPGISPAEGRRIFRPFSKSAQQAAHSAPGVGLGLALSRRLARDMGGDLRLEDSRGGGASFVVTLPGAANYSKH